MQLLKFLPLITLLSYLPPTNAQITLDGSFGRHDTLTGPRYDINAELGQQVGHNLFHSFDQFNLQAGEIATFSGAAEIQNVISRVTGGQPSFINGTIASTIPQADMYFINPAGILFGEQAQLNVLGAMHFTTADEIRLEDGGKFAATEPSTSLLTVAPPSAFGFLTNTPAGITLQGSQLTVPTTETLSFIGGDLDLQANSLLQAAEGRINLASVASTGEVIPSLTDLAINGFTQRGLLTIAQSQLEVSGEGGGSIYIRAGQFFIEQSQVLGITQGDKMGGVIDVAVEEFTLSNQTRFSTTTESSGDGGDIILRVDNAAILIGSDPDAIEGIFANTLSQAPQAGNAGTISITAQNLTLSQTVQIISETFGIGEGGSVDINVGDKISLSTVALLSTSSNYEGELAGNAGSLSIQTHELNLDGATIASSTFGTGQAGKISVVATGQIDLDNGAGIFSLSYPQSSLSTGNAGKISIQAHQLSINEGAQIVSATLGDGQGGMITLDIADTLAITGYLLSGNPAAPFLPSGINVSTAAQGNAGAIDITARNIMINGGGAIGSDTYGPGTGDQIKVEATDSIIISGSMTEALSDGNVEITSTISSASQEGSTGNAGQIVLTTPSLILDNGGKISTSAYSTKAGKIELNVARLDVNNKASITSESQGAGDAGNIVITASEQINLTQQAKISTQAAQAGGGNITLQMPQRLLLEKAGAITTSVKSGTGGGGNVTVETPVFVILNEGEIRAQADAGRGGDIRINTENYLRSNESVVSASSRLGVDGVIVISSPNETVAEEMLSLPVTLIDISALLKKSCDALTLEEFENRSHFTYIPLTGTPQSPFDWQPSPPLQTSLTTQQNSSSSPSQPPIRLALLTRCQIFEEDLVVPVQLF
jgi:filamentous hemagglutinin family protein